MARMLVSDQAIRRFVALMVILTVTPCGAEVKEKLAELESKRDKINSLHMISTTSIRMGGGSREMTIETWQKRLDGKQLSRREIITKSASEKDAEPVESKTLMVNDGNTAWREAPVLGSKRLVFKGSSKDRSDFADLRTMLEGGEARMRDGETILEQPCVCFDIKGKEGNDRFLATFCISERFGLILRSIIEGTDQSVTETRVKEFKIDEPVDNRLFSYKPPGDAQVIDSDKLGKRTDD